MASMSILGSTYISEAMDRGQGTTTSGSHVPRSILELGETDVVLVFVSVVFGGILVFSGCGYFSFPGNLSGWCFASF